MHRAIMIIGLAAVASTAAAQGGRSVSQGRGTADIANVYDCPTAEERPSPVGKVTSRDGKVWTMPAVNNFASGPRAADLYNECTNAKPASLAQVPQSPVVEVDADGEVITGYLMADNYFELYVNGKLVAVDATPFTPFNSAAVRFKAKRPVSYAVKLIDWEENLALGSESAPGGGFHPGDGGFIARFSDGTVTDESWKAQSFYIAPLASPDAVVETGNVHATPGLARTYPAAPAQAACGDQCYAVHYPVPANWTAKAFDASGWPAASLFTPEEMGIDRQPGYAGFTEAFAGAKVIWSSNLVYDNVVLTRKTGR